MLQRHWRGYAVRYRDELEADAQLRAKRPVKASEFRAHLVAVLAEQGKTMEEHEMEATVRATVKEDLRAREKLRTKAFRMRSDGECR